MSDPSPAARKDDLIAHNQSQLLRFFGAIADNAGTAWAATRVIRFVLCGTNPAGWALLGASIVVEFLISKAIDKVADKVGEMMAEGGIPAIKKGSHNVSINLRPAARGSEEHGDPLKCHEGKKLIQGSEWVSINKIPAARLNDWTNDSGKVATASPNVIIGGPQTSADRESEYQQYVEYAFSAVNLANAYKKGWKEFGKEVGKKVGEKAKSEALDQIWGFLAQ
jgi:uncharacterized Zn-binding protein involved in type VI secretion